MKECPHCHGETVCKRDNGASRGIQMSRPSCLKKAGLDPKSKLQVICSVCGRNRAN